jgi:hypothetical protein
MQLPRLKSACFLAGIIQALISIPILSATELKTETIQDWNQYLKWAEAKIQRELTNPKIFLIQNALASGEKSSIQKQIQSGEIIVRPMTNVVPSGTHFSVTNGEIHHWWGTVQIRNIKLDRLMQFLQDYDHHAGRFSDVERSRVIEKRENQYKIFLRLRRSKAFVTAFYNTEQECRYTFYESNRAFSHSIATKIAEVENPGTPSEREKLPGNDRGFLWRLASWWRFEQKGNDVIIELESASLSRDIPFAIRFIPGISGYIRSTPRETLESVLASIRKAMNE